MGGMGSGPYGGGTKRAKKTVESCYTIDIRNWQREKVLEPGVSFITSWKVTPRTLPWQKKISYKFEIGVLVQEEKVTLVYEEDGEQRTEDIFLCETQTNFGTRKWLLCPVCGERKATLHLDKGYFACRKCHDLNYRSSQLSGDMGYYHHQLRKLSRKLGEEYDPISHLPPLFKPKGMHQSTFDRHRERYEDLVIMRERTFVEQGKRILGWK